MGAKYLCLSTLPHCNCAGYHNTRTSSMQPPAQQNCSIAMHRDVTRLHARIQAREHVASFSVPACQTAPAGIARHMLFDRCSCDNSSSCRGLLFCMEYLEENLHEWLSEELQVRRQPHGRHSTHTLRWPQVPSEHAAYTSHAHSIL